MSGIFSSANRTKRRRTSTKRVTEERDNEAELEGKRADEEESKHLNVQVNANSPVEEVLPHVFTDMDLTYQVEEAEVRILAAPWQEVASEPVAGAFIPYKHNTDFVFADGACVDVEGVVSSALEFLSSDKGTIAVLLGSNLCLLGTWQRAFGKYNSVTVGNQLLHIMCAPCQTTTSRTPHAPHLIGAVQYVLFIYRKTPSLYTSFTSALLTNSDYAPTMNIIADVRKKETTRLVLKRPHPTELSNAVYASIIDRYTIVGQYVVELGDSGVCSASQACLLLGRRYLGFSVRHHDTVMKRLRAVAAEMRTASPETITRFFNRLPTDVLHGIISSVPPFCRNKDYESLLSDFDRAVYEAAIYNCTIRPSSVDGAGFGYFTTAAVKKGDLLGYYWGPWEFHKSTPTEGDNSRLMIMLKFAIDENGQRFHVYNRGCASCATSYSNCPVGVPVQPNASFQERDLKNNSTLDSLDPAPSDMVGLYALCDLEPDTEIFSDYGEHYGKVTDSSEEEENESEEEEE
jgi:hypothetical protein